MTKSSDWQYEQEWRAMVIDNKPADYRFVPSLTVKRLILGVNTSAGIEESLVREFGEHVEIERVQLCEKQFSLTRHSVSAS